MSSPYNQKVIFAGKQFLRDFQKALLSGINIPYNIKVKDEAHKSIKLKVLELHENSIVTQGFTVKDGFSPDYVLFKGRRKGRKIKVIDTMITPEIAILYLEKDPRKYSHSRRFELSLTHTIFTASGIYNQIKTGVVIKDPSKSFQLIPNL